MSLKAGITLNAKYCLVAQTFVWLAGLLLLGAATIKLVLPETNNIAEAVLRYFGLHNTRAFAFLEFATGCYLIRFGSFHARLGLWLVACIFFGFSIFSGWALKSGLSCGCFGPMAPASLVWGLDVLMFIASITLLAVRPHCNIGLAREWSGRALKRASRYVVGGLVAVLLMSIAIGNTHQQPAFEVLFDNPIALRGAPLPTEITVTAETAALRQGRWSMFIKREGCETCEVVEKNLLSCIRPGEKVARITANDRGWRLELPGTNQSKTGERKKTFESIWPGPSPFLYTPTELTLNDGVIIDVLDRATFNSQLTQKRQ